MDDRMMGLVNIHGGPFNWRAKAQRPHLIIVCWKVRHWSGPGNEKEDKERRIISRCERMRVGVPWLSFIISCSSLQFKVQALWINSFCFGLFQSSSWLCTMTQLFLLRGRKRHPLCQLNRIQNFHGWYRGKESLSNLLLIMVYPLLNMDLSIVCTNVPKTRLRSPGLAWMNSTQKGTKPNESLTRTKSLELSWVDWLNALPGYSAKLSYRTVECVH